MSVCGRIYLLRPSLFWVDTRRRSVAAYRRFGQPNGTSFQGPAISHWALILSSLSLFNKFFSFCSRFFTLSFYVSCILLFIFVLLLSLLHVLSSSTLLSLLFFLNSILLYKFGCQSLTNFDMSACVKVKDCHSNVMQQYRFVTKHGWNHKVVTTSGCKRCTRFCGHYNLQFYPKH